MNKNRSTTYRGPNRQTLQISGTFDAVLSYFSATYPSAPLDIASLGVQYKVVKKVDILLTTVFSPNVHRLYLCPPPHFLLVESHISSVWAQFQAYYGCRHFAEIKRTVTPCSYPPGIPWHHC